MAETYAVVWSDRPGSVAVGRLELRTDALILTSPGAPGRDCVVSFSDITGVRLGSTSERLNELKTVVLDRRSGGAILIGAVNGLGEVFEIVDVLGAFAELESVVVRVPVHRGAAVHVRELLRRGPPFDPATVEGLTHHEVFVSDREVLFLFQGRSINEAVRRLARSPTVWSAAIEWRRYMTGAPTVVESAYAWSPDG